MAEIGGPPQLEKNNWRLRDVRSRKCAPYPARRAEPGRRWSPLHGGVVAPSHDGLLARWPRAVAPSRGRGRPVRGAKMAYNRLRSPLHGGVVAPDVIPSHDPQNGGRPFTGAWSPPSAHAAQHIGRWVAPSRGRGRPFKSSGIAPPSFGGRPFTGAWIETHISCGQDGTGVVAPSRGRGLKLKSHPVTGAQLAEGRPFTGAWIETGNKG